MSERSFVPPIMGCDLCGNAEAPVAYLVSVHGADAACCTKCFAPPKTKLVAFLASYYMDATIFGAYHHTGAVVLGIMLLIDAKIRGQE